MAFSPSEAAFEGFRLTREKPVAVLFGWPLVYLVCFSLIVGAVVAAMGPQVLNDLKALSAMSKSAQADPKATMAVMSKMAGFFGLLFPLAMIFSAINHAAVFRAVLRPQEKGFFYFRIGGDELRILLVNVVLTVIFVCAVVVAAIAVGVAAGVAKAAGGTTAAWLSGVLLGLVCIGLVIWVAVRLSLALPVTFAEKRIALFDSWRLTQGRSWSLIGMLLLATIFSMVVSLLGGLIANAAAAVTGGGLAVLGTIKNPDWTALAPSLIAPLAAYGVINLVLASLQTAIVYAPLASAYRTLKDEA